MSDMQQFTATPTVEELEAEIERLTAELDEMCTLNEIACKQRNEAQAEIERLTASDTLGWETAERLATENKQLREELQYWKDVQQVERGALK